MGLEIDGIDEALQLLGTLGEPDRADTLMIQALTHEAKKIQQAAKLLCPVDTGELRRSIEVSDIPNGVCVGTDAEYAEHVEYGTGKRGNPEVEHTTKEFWRYQDDDGNWYTSHGQPPRPFLAPAYEAYKNEIGENVKNYVIGGLKNNG